jgi:hypothetical protein
MAGACARVVGCLVRVPLAHRAQEATRAALAVSWTEVMPCPPSRRGRPAGDFLYRSEVWGDVVAVEGGEEAGGDEVVEGGEGLLADGKGDAAGEVAHAWVDAGFDEAGPLVPQRFVPV